MKRLIFLTLAAGFVAHAETLPPIAAMPELPSATLAHRNAPNSVRCRMLVTLALPASSLDAIAGDAAKLGIPLVLQGLPVTVDRRRDAARVDFERAERLMKPRVEMGAGFEIDPRPFEAVEKAVQGRAPLPLLLCEGTQSAEAFPGDVRPLYASALAARRAKSPEIRRGVEALLARSGLAEEARRILP